MFGHEENGWTRVESSSREWKAIRYELKRRVAEGDFEELDCKKIERCMLSFYTKGEDSVRLYRIPAKGRSNGTEDDEGDQNTGEEAAYLHVLLHLPNGWEEKLKGTDGKSSNDPGSAAEEVFELWHLDGTSPPIHKVNDTFGIKLPSVPRAEENGEPGELSEADQKTLLGYLRFFCEFVHGEEGPFYIIDADEEIEVSGTQESVAQESDSEISGEPVLSVVEGDAKTNGTPAIVSKKPDAAEGGDGDTAITTTGEDGPEARPDAKPESDDSADAIEYSVNWDSPLSSTPTRFVGVKDNKFVLDARVAYSTAGFVARFLIQNSGMVQMEDDEPKYPVGSIRVKNPLRLASVRLPPLDARKPISLAEFQALLRGELPAWNPEQYIDGDSIVIKSRKIVAKSVSAAGRTSQLESTNSKNRSCSAHQPQAFRAKAVRVEDCTSSSGVDLSGFGFDCKIEFLKCRFAFLDLTKSVFRCGLEIKHCWLCPPRKSAHCALNLSEAVLEAGLDIWSCVLGPLPNKPNSLSLEQETQSIRIGALRRPDMVNMWGMRCINRVSLFRSIVRGSASFTGLHAEQLFVQNCAFHGDVRVSWTRLHVLQFANDQRQVVLRQHDDRDVNLESKTGVAGEFLAGSVECTMFALNGMYIGDSATIWKSRIDDLLVTNSTPDNPKTPFGGTAPSHPDEEQRKKKIVPAHICGAFLLQDTAITSAVDMKGIRVEVAEYRGKTLDATAAMSKVAESAEDRESSDTQQEQHGSNARGTPHSATAGWKLSWDGKLAIVDCSIGFDLKLQGLAASTNTRIGDRTLANLLFETTHGVHVEGVKIGGDLDFRGTKTCGEIHIENVTIDGHLRVGLLAVLESIVDPSKGSVKNRSESSESGEDSAEKDNRWWLEDTAKAATILKHARAECGMFYMRNVRVKGDVRLDGLDAGMKRNGDEIVQERQSLDEMQWGTVGILLCEIGGDLSFILESPSENKWLEFCENEVERKGEKKVCRSAHIKHLPEENRVLGHAHILNGLDLTGTRCAHFLVSGACFVLIPETVRAGESKKDRPDRVRFRKFQTDRFELVDSPIKRECDLRALDVDRWEFPERASDEESREKKSREKKSKKEKPKGDVELLKDLLSMDPEHPRDIYTSIERSLLSRGDIHDAESIRKHMWKGRIHNLKKNAKKNDVAWYKYRPGESTWLQVLLCRVAMWYGYGKPRALTYPAALCVVAWASLTLIHYMTDRDLAVESSLMHAIAAAPLPDVHALDLLLVSVRHTFPAVDLMASEDFRPSVEPLFLGVSANHIMDGVTVLAWGFWLNILIMISLRIFRSAGLRSWS